MSVVQTVDGVEYPESDGKPMGETDLHRDWMIRILELLRWRYRGQQVYLASDLIMYYEEGDPTKSIVPDDFVVLNCNPDRRRTYKLWEEPGAPHVAFEVTSKSSKKDDTIYKPKVYAQIGVREYFVYDPTADYLDPSLQGFRLGENDSHTRIEPDEKGRLRCEQLGIELHLAHGDLFMHDSQTGRLLLTQAEAADAARRAAEIRAQEAEARSARLEEELRRLRDEQKRDSGFE